MKKLTPFQKKLARWFSDPYSIQAMEGVAFIVLLISAILAVNTILETKEMWKIVLSTTASLAMLYAVFLLDAIKFWKWSLAEAQVKKAEQFSEKYPQYATRVAEFIKEAFGQDDGGKLKEALEKFETLIDKKRSLICSANHAKEIKTEIAALEKELGV